METDHKMSMEVLESIRNQMEILLKEDQYDSVLYLGSIVCTIPQSKTNKHPMQTLFNDLYTLYADALFKKCEYRRALKYYSTCLAAKYPKGIRGGIMTTDEASIRFKLAKCMFHLDDIQSAIKHLKLIPHDSKTLGMQMLLGKLNAIQGLTREAEAAYITALKINPYALEATIALAELAGKNEECSPTNLEDCEIVSFYSQSRTQEIVHVVNARWLQCLVDAHIQLHSHQLHSALQSFEAVDKHIGVRGHHNLLYRAKIHMEMENTELAMRLFVQARQCDVSSVDMMDIFARLLQQSGLTMQLNSLVHDLFTITESRPETWLAAAWYSELKGDRGTAHQLCDRALSIDPSFSRSYLCRGHILMAMDRPEHAVVAFSKASKLEKSIQAFEGLAEALCSMVLKGIDKYLDAMNVARQALLFMPHSPRAALLLGTVLSLKPDSRERARKAFEKALSMQPNLLRAHFGVVDIFIVEANYNEAIRRLEHLAQQSPRDVVFIKLGDVLTQRGAYDEALPQYHRALAMNPNSTKAIRGVERVEKYLRGEEPKPRHFDLHEQATEEVDGYNQHPYRHHRQ